MSAYSAHRRAIVATATQIGFVMTRVSRHELTDVPAALPTARRLRPSDRRPRVDVGAPSLVAPRGDDSISTPPSQVADEDNVRRQLVVARQRARDLEEELVRERAGLIARDRQIEWLERQILELKQSLRDANLMILSMEDDATPKTG